MDELMGCTNDRDRALGPNIVLSLLAVKEGYELLCRTTTMTYSILVGSTHLSKRLTACLNRSKHGVVAETTFATLLVEDCTLDDAFKEMLLSITDESYGRTETSTAIRLVLQLVEQTFDVGLSIVARPIAVHIAEACCEYAWTSIESLHLKSRIIGEAIYAIVLVDVACLLEGVTLERIRRFGNVIMATYVCQTPHRIPFAQYLSYFFQFVGVV